MAHFSIMFSFLLLFRKNSVSTYLGTSKRGWTTWLTAAVDYERVDLMAPIFFDELNMALLIIKIFIVIQKSVYKN